MKTALYRSTLILSLLLIGASAVAGPPAGEPSHHHGPVIKKPDIHPGYPVRKVPRGAISFSLGGLDFFFHTGIFYQWKNGSYVVASAPLGATVPVLPTGCSIQVVAGQTYYVLRDSYFRPVPGGYRVVSRPTETVVVKEVASAKSEDVTVWVQNDNGSRTPVRLTASGDGQWIGPKGEYYSSFPSELQLKPVYGVLGAVKASSVASESRTQIVWIENLNGSSTPIELERQDDGTWIGPLDEVYPELPSADDLRSAYGLD